VCAPATATVAGVAFGVPGLPDVVAEVSPGVAVLPVGLRPVVSDAEAGVPGAAGDELLVVTVLREPGPGVTVLRADFTA
jgi:hypothetical protein